MKEKIRLVPSPEFGLSWECLKNSKKVNVIAERVRWRVIRDEPGKLDRGQAIQGLVGHRHFRCHSE